MRRDDLSAMEPALDAVRADSERPFPTGVVTFLFTDIEGSTSRWEMHRDAMTIALREHDRLMRAAIIECSGHVFKTVGDAFCATFTRPEDAIRAALEAQRALERCDWTAVDGLRVRMALHCGSADERDGDYFGPEVNRVARLLSIGHGGQVLLSHTAVELLRNALPEATVLSDLGEQRLKDLAAPEPVAQLVASDLQAIFPPLRSLTYLPNNLPEELTSFVGRDGDIAELRNRLQAMHLVTLCGPGGIGKTRCALHLGAELLAAFAGGVWLVELAAIRDPEFVPNAVANVLAVKQNRNESPIDALAAFLKSRQLLLILDNCEHVIDSCARLVHALLSASPDVRILATSREPLKILGECVYRLPSLDVASAVSLFVARAQALDAGFSLSDENAPVVADICRRLDGIALAIELAAARVRVLAPRQLYEKLDASLRILTGGSRTALPRQQTMRALLDWSYDFLAEDERRFFRHLAVFADGFSLSAALALGRGEDVDEIDVLDLLGKLVDKSLVVAEPGADESSVRYRMLESMREYGLEKLRREEGERNALQCVAVWFDGFISRAHTAWETQPSAVWQAEMEPELGNLRAVLGWRLEAGNDALEGARLAADARRFWGRISPADGRYWLCIARERLGDGASPRLQAALQLAEAQVLVALHQYVAALPVAQRAASAYDELHDQRAASEARGFAGISLALLGELPQGIALLETAMESYRLLCEPQLLAYATEDLALAHLSSGKMDTAATLFREAMKMFAELGNERAAGATACNLAELEYRAGNLDEALKFANQATAANMNSYEASTYFANLSAYLISADLFTEGRQAAREALRIARSDFDFALGLQRLAAIAALRNSSIDSDRGNERAIAARLSGFVDGKLESLGLKREHTEQREYERIMNALPTSLGQEAFNRFVAEGRRWRQEQAFTAAMRL